MSLHTCNPLQEAANPLEMGDEVFCGCCLTSNVILLESCKHVLFYEKLFQNVQKVARSLTYICITCHSIVKKLSKFHDMMMETQNLLYNKVIPYNLKRQKLQLTITEHLDIEPTEIAIKSEQISNDENSIKIESENTLDICFEPKIENNEDDLNNTDNTYQNDLSNIEENIDEHVYLNQEIASDNIDEDIPNLIEKTDGDSYSFDQYIDLDKPKQAFTSKGEVYPYISRTITGKRFTLPEIDSNEVKCVTVTLKDALAELHKKENSNQFKKMKFKCTKCFAGFNLKNIYEAHMNKHNIKEYDFHHYMICDFCECSVLPQHAITHYSNHFIRYQCVECNKLYATYKVAKTHCIMVHDKSLKKCDLCSFTTNSCRTLRYHKETKHVISECKICGKALANSQSLKYHISTVHNKEPLELKPCTQCNKLLKPRSVRSHMKQVHGGGDRNYCVDCNKYFKSNKCLEIHYKYHSNHVDSKIVTCDYCGHTFRRKQEVALHILRQHMPEMKKIKCNHCDKMFSTKSFATLHEKTVHSKNTESNERNHMCDYCGKTYKSAIILKAHVRIHTGERPYICNICDATFTQSGPLYMHRRLVHLEGKRKK